MYSFKITNPKVTFLLFHDFLQKGGKLMQHLESDLSAPVSSDRPNKRLPGSELLEGTGTKRQRNRQGASASSSSSSLNSEEQWNALKSFFSSKFEQCDEWDILQTLYNNVNLIDYTASFSEQPLLLCLSKMLEQASRLSIEGIRERLACFYGNDSAIKLLATCDIYELFTLAANPAQSRSLVRAMILQHRSWLTELKLYQLDLTNHVDRYLVSQVMVNAIQLKELCVYDTPIALQTCAELLGTENRFNVGINIISPQPNASHLPRMIPSLAMFVQHTMNALTTIKLEHVMIDEVAAATGLGKCLNAASNLSHLELDVIRLTEAAVIALAAQLTRLQLRTLVLSVGRLVNEGARALLGALLNGGRLENIKLHGHIELSSMDGILNNPALQSLSLKYGRSLHRREMRKLLALTSLRELDTNLSRVPRTLSVLTAALARNHPLTSLVLGFGDVASLITSLESNTCLQSLRIDADKYISEAPPEPLINLVKNNRTLSSLHLRELSLETLLNSPANTALLASAFAYNQTITSLDLFESISDSCNKTAVLKILNALSEMIVLSSLKINITWDEEFMVVLCKLLAVNRLVFLSLQWSIFQNFSSFQLLGEQLTSNTSLITLDLGRCTYEFELPEGLGDSDDSDDSDDDSLKPFKIEQNRAIFAGLRDGIRCNGITSTLKMDCLQGTDDLRAEIVEICALNKFNQERKQSTLTGMLSSMFFGRRVSAERNDNESNPVFRM